MATKTQDGKTEVARGENGGRGFDDPHDAGLALRTVLLLVAGMACFGSATPVSVVVGRHFPIWLGSCLRLIIAAAVLVPALVISQHRIGEPIAPSLRSLEGADRWRLAAMASIGTFGFSAFMLLGMRHAPGTVGAVVMATTPAVTGIGAVLFLH